MKRQDFYYELPEELIAQEIERVAKVKIGANKKSTGITGKLR